MSAEEAAKYIRLCKDADELTKEYKQHNLGGGKQIVLIAAFDTTETANGRY